MTAKKEHILVIRLGALGDLVFCFQSFHEIRHAHPDAEIALLTRAPFAAFARSLPWVDRVIIDTHPTFATPLAWARLRHEIANFAPTRVYDLQGKRRQTILYVLLGGPFGPAWSGASPLCKFPRPWPPAPEMSFVNFLAVQLRAAGVPATPPPDLAWLDAPVEKFALPSRYAVLIPGCSPDAPHKRWPAEKYAAVAQRLHAEHLPCVIVGTASEAEVAAVIKNAAPNIIDLCGKTSLSELAGILRRAVGVIGNDTGPMHLAAALNTPTLALFSGKTNPVWSKPSGAYGSWRQSQILFDLNTDDVLAAFALTLQHAKDESR